MTIRKIRKNDNRIEYLENEVIKIVKCKSLTYKTDTDRDKQDKTRKWILIWS